MTAHLWNPYPAPIFDQNGRIASGAQAAFYFAGTTIPLTVYADPSLSVPRSYPVVANATGVFPPIYLPYIDYSVRVLDANHVEISFADGIANPPPPSSGGGGGIVVSADMVPQVGDMIWNPKPAGGPRTGWVRANGQTIGSGVSGATERANADTQNLFTFLWNNFPDADCPVSGGRGVSAVADWAANKAIGTPSMRGLVPVGADDMGGLAAQKIQVIGTCNVVGGSPNIVVSSAAGLGRGMYVVIGGVASGVILSISGTTVTLDTNYAGSTTNGIAFRASYFPDAQAPGSVGGVQNVTQTTAEMASHNHGVTDPGHPHSYDYGTAAGSTLVLAVSNASGINSLNTSVNTTGISIQNAGQGLPSQIIQPGRIGTWYVRL
jgi:hypothetical protein